MKSLKSILKENTTPLNTIGMGNPAFDDGEMTEPIAPICKKRKKKKKKTEEE